MLLLIDVGKVQRRVLAEVPRRRHHIPGAFLVVRRPQTPVPLEVGRYPSEHVVRPDDHLVRDGEYLILAVAVPSVGGVFGQEVEAQGNQ